MRREKGLDNPQVATTAWKRFRRVMAWMALVGALCVGVALMVLRAWAGPMPIHMVVATVLGVWLTFMLGTALMALTFLSSGTGHDEQVLDPLKDDYPLDD
ncbi:hypothetical protein SAMN02927924_01491 [Sphingobium faniae]|nr:hypothetical protein SAMN02927924_01491 [Sphingobium faniae]